MAPVTGSAGAEAERLARELLAAFRARAATLATAESCTGGLVAAAITDLPGASDVFDRGFVTYSNAAKTALLAVAPALIDRHGAVSEPVARAMAGGALAASDARVAVAVTGVAGPGGTGAKPEGLVWFAAATADGTVAERRDFGPLGRADVRTRSVEAALALALQALARLP
jgi:nicotinamide-nucleotide amidase